ncbi:hypothetical protein NLJ89_g4242 [Agrocybe chaxingu]|uniref:Pre-rRNA-processing protein n=1 Tax=Agrocybe chaxingu TaxID=84603 RepID=A0A9W8K376_9AGAR|nr:hypothetical protein NLJ89_g4242 [Agrocybe chaxingu]
MPKSAKKRKEKVADFSKAKLKLGKGKTLVNNAIDTSFKARSIVLPSQSIAVEKDSSEPITKRQLTFSDLLSHLKHYNAGTRKGTNLLHDCFMQEDLIPHSPLLLLYTTSAQTHIFPEIRIDAIRFLDILLDCIPEMLTSGWSETSETHGSRVLGGYLGILNAGTKYGETEGDIHGPVKATSTASVVLTPASKLVVLRSLSKFLLVALSSSNGVASQEGVSTNKPLDAWFMRNAFPSQEAFSAFESLFGTSSSSKATTVTRTWQAEVDPEDNFGDIFTQCYPLLNGGAGEPWTLHELSDIHDVVSAKNTFHSQGTSASFVAHLANTLHSTIIEAYLDSAPSVFSPSSSPSETEVQLVLSVVRITRTLYHVIVQSTEKVDPIQVGQLEKIINYMAPHFPTFRRDHRFDQLYEEFDLVFCELTSMLLNATQNASAHLQSTQKQRKANRKGKAPSSSSSAQTERVTQYIIRRLRGEGTSASQIAAPISPVGYLALMPTVWALVSNPTANPHEAGAVLHATLHHAIRVTSKSACKRTTVEFVARLMLVGPSSLPLSQERVEKKTLCPSIVLFFTDWITTLRTRVQLDPERYYRGDFSSESDPEVKAKFDAWLLHLPQVLWEVGSSHIPTVEVILRVLLRILQRRSRTGTQSEMTASLQSRLVPYFYIDHPSRGPLAGPFKKLPPQSGASASRVRLLALDVVATILALGRQDGKDFEGLARAVGLAVTGEEEAAYWAHISMSK